ncbi:acyltransferase family protein [Legionella tucsonensis]|uniref:O-antigen acetylase n=1 Tax=Legionella tucsonensis TaxID=40335 RepID=A0A0W0ZTT5_9GAMM|nr:acyltransferase [Legionella tucsonensis]KTD72240.1 O-antigen acetylase [Legionella tucsonensis]
MNKNTLFTSDSTYFVCADGIRGLACLIVLITHATTMFFSNLSPYLAGSGKIGVWLFFILSAFLLTTRFKTTGFSSAQLFHYGVSRFLRIIPLYLFALVIYKFLGTTDIHSWKNVEEALFLKQGFSHLWTIPVEFKFYFYLPLLAYLFIKLSKNNNPSILILLFIILILLEQFFWPYWLTPINSIHVNHYFTPFTTGVFFAAIYDRLKQYVTPVSANWLGLATIIACLISLPITKKYFFKIPYDLSLANQFVYFGFLWAIFIVYNLQGKGFWGKILSTYFFRMIGKWSYSIYLFHWLVLMKYIQIWPNQIFAMLAAFVSAIGVGGIVYYFVEQPIEYLRKAAKTNFNQKKAWRLFLTE